jgi:hypothetical protein
VAQLDRVTRSQTAPIWLPSTRVSGAFELTGIGMVVPHHGSDGKWYAYPTAAAQPNGPFASREEAQTSLDGFPRLAAHG